MFKKIEDKGKLFGNNNNAVDGLHESSDVSSSSESTESASCDESESSSESDSSESSEPSNRNIGLIDDLSLALSSKSKLSLSR